MRKLFYRLFGINPCPQCGSWDTHRGHYISGWNDYCQQASGDDGLLCTSCWHIEFDQPYNVRVIKYKKHAPWVRPYKMLNAKS